MIFKMPLARLFITISSATLFDASKRGARNDTERHATAHDMNDKSWLFESFPESLSRE